MHFSSPTSAEEIHGTSLAQVPFASDSALLLTLCTLQITILLFNYQQSQQSTEVKDCAPLDMSTEMKWINAGNKFLATDRIIQQQQRHD